MRLIFEALDAYVIWDAEGRMVFSITSKRDLVILEISNEEVICNEVRQTIDTPAQIIGNRVFVLLRFVAEMLDKDVVHDEETMIVLVTSK